MGEGAGNDERWSWKIGRNIKRRANLCFGNSSNFKVNILLLRGLWGGGLKYNQQDLCSWGRETRGRSPPYLSGSNLEEIGNMEKGPENGQQPWPKMFPLHTTYELCGPSLQPPTSLKLLCHQLLTRHLHQVIIIVSFIKLIIFLLAAPLVILLLVTDTSPPPDTTMEADTLPDVFIPFFFPFKIIHSFLFFFWDP